MEVQEVCWLKLVEIKKLMEITLWQYLTPWNEIRLYFIFQIVLGNEWEFFNNFHEGKIPRLYYLSFSFISSGTYERMKYPFVKFWIVKTSFVDYKNVDWNL